MPSNVSLVLWPGQVIGLWSDQGCFPWTNTLGSRWRGLPNSQWIYWCFATLAEWFLVPFSWRCSRQPLSCSEIKPKTSTRQGEKQESTNFGGSFKFLAFLSTYPFQRWLELVGPDWCALRWVGGRVQNFRTRTCFHKHWLTGCAIFQTLSQWYLSIFPDHYWFAIGI